MSDTEQLLSHFYLKIDGKQADPAFTGNITDLVVENSLYLPDVATISVLDLETAWIDNNMLLPGKTIEISARIDTREQHIFSGEIVELEMAWEHGLQKMIIRAFNRLHRLARGRYARSFQNVTDGDLIRKIAQEVGLSAKVDRTSEVHKHIMQANETNLSFLQRRAAAHGYVLYVDKTTLCCVAPTSHQAPIELHWGTDMFEFRPRLSTIGQVSEVIARGWNPDTKSEVVGKVKTSKIAPEVGVQQSGGDWVKKGFHMPNVTYLVADRPLRAQSTASTLAQAVADRQASQYIEADGASAGNPKLVAGARIKIQNIGTRFSGTYVVTSTTHRFGAGAYTTHFSVSGLQATTLMSLLAPQDEQPTALGLVIGVVTDNKDPDNLGRVRVKFPWLSADDASFWARVVIVGGGKQRGIEFLPEIDDEVLVGFEQNDFNYPYILGGLWNKRDQPPVPSSTAIQGGKVQQRVIRSRVGHTITLDDSDNGGIIIEDKGGNKIVITSKDNSLAVEIKGNANIQVKGNTTLKTNANLSLEAQGHVDIKGKGVSIDGGPAPVDIKGAIINLN